MYFGCRINALDPTGLNRGIDETRMEPDKILHVLLGPPKNMASHFENSNRRANYMGMYSQYSSKNITNIQLLLFFNCLIFVRICFIRYRAAHDNRQDDTRLTSHYRQITELLSIILLHLFMFSSFDSFLLCYYNFKICD